MRSNVKVKKKKNSVEKLGENINCKYKEHYVKK